MVAVRGMEVSASNMNQINGGYTFTKHQSSGADNFDTRFYSHRQNGELLFSVHVTCGLFGGGNMALDKRVDGTWVTQKTWSWGWNTDEQINQKSYGSGYYRLRSTDSWALDSLDFYFYCGDVSCVTGGRLVCFDTYSSSNGGTMGGELTAELANTHRLGQEGH